MSTRSLWDSTLQWGLFIDAVTVTPDATNRTQELVRPCYDLRKCKWGVQTCTRSKTDQRCGNPACTALKQHVCGLKKRRRVQLLESLPTSMHRPTHDILLIIHRVRRHHHQSPGLCHQADAERLPGLLSREHEDSVTRVGRWHSDKQPVINKHVSSIIRRDV